MFFSVVKALLLREIQTRFGSQKLGYIWMVVEPMAMIIVFSLIHSQMGSKTPYSMPVFLAVSFVSYNLFRAVAMQSMNAFKANKGLFVYKQVKPFDTLVSRFILEFFIQFLVAFVLIVIGLYLNIQIEVKDLLFVLLGVFWFAFFGFSLGVLFAVLGYFFENFPKLINLVFLPMFFLSGLFYTADSLPENIRNILLYNPIFQFEEMIHGYFFYSLNDKYVNYQYIFLWTIIPLFIGLWLYKKSERKIIMS
ncbi:ABC transporter permease [Caminibacter sp.]